MIGVRTYGTRFQLKMAARSGGCSIVRFNDDGSDAGLYLHHFHGSIGTSLAARGSLEQLATLAQELRAGAVLDDCDRRG